MLKKGYYITGLLFLSLLAVGQSTLEADSIFAGGHTAIGDSLFEQERWDEADAAYNEALTLYRKHPKFDRLQGILLQKIGNALRSRGKFAEATKFYFQGLYKLKAGDAEKEIVESYARISVHLSSTDPLLAISYADSAVQRVGNYLTIDSLQLAHYLFEFADRHRTASKYREGVIHYLEVLDLLARLPEVDSMLLFNVHYRLGGVLSRLDKREEGLEHYDKSEKILLEKYSENQMLLRNYYQNVAHLLDDLADFDRSLDYRRKYCEYFFSKNDSTSFEVSRAMNDLGLTYEKRGEYDQARIWYEKSLANNQRIYGPKSIYTAFLLNNVGNIYKHLGRYEEGLPLLHQAYKLFTEYFGSDHIFPANVSSNIGNTYNLMGYPEQALPYNTAALNIRRLKLGPYHEDLARDYWLLGDIYKSRGDYSQAITYYDSASIATKYDDKKGFASVIAFSRLFQALDQKADTYSQWYQSTGELNLLIKSIEVYFVIDELTDYLRRSYKSEGSKRYLLANRRTTYTNAMDNLITLYQITHDKDYLFEAFRMSEKSRSIILYEALVSSQAKDFGNIPDEIIQNEATLKQQIADLEKREFEQQKKKDIDKVGLAEVEDQLVVIKNQYRKFLKDMASKYPSFFELKYDLDTRSIEEVREQLSPDQLLIEYVLGEEKIFGFAITADTFDVQIIDLDFDIHTLISEFRTSIFGYALSSHQSAALFDSLQAIYADHAFLLYHKLLDPFRNYLTQKSTLIISPDGELYYLPFEALFSQAPRIGDNFKNYPYLVRSHAVQYVPSATLWNEMKSRKQNAGASGILAFAPQFTDATAYASIVALRSGLSPLKYNEAEIQRISQVYTVESYKGPEALKTKFLAQASNFSVLHLATHGKANDIKGDYSYLAFSDDPLQPSSNLLYSADIYAMDLNAEMVVLSACETGIGELQNGEGIISLARAFSYAGAKSIITTLWAVNDQATSGLMTFFYENLKMNKLKPDALRNAKLQYLDQVMDPLEAHPFYWAGVVSIGDLNPLTNVMILSPIVIKVIVSLVILMLIFFLSKLVYRRNWSRHRP